REQRRGGGQRAAGRPRRGRGDRV
ncbi:MAG: hypothetical protein AVDCRST_MAG11-1567, partial [uncultured Gemmatimonadaceae bacterium]